MIEKILKIKKWGNSLGVILPPDVIRRKNLKNGSTIEIFIPETNKKDLSELFGTMKFKKSTQQIKDEMRKGW